MSWLPKLLATYDACKGKEPEAVTEWLKEHPDAYPTLVTK